MKKRSFLITMVIIFTIEISALFVFAVKETDNLQNAVAVNEVVQSVQNNWHTIENHKNQTGLDYVVLNSVGTVVFKTKEGLSESINEAVIHRDTILDIEDGEKTVGKIIIHNDSTQIFQNRKHMTVIILLTAMFIQCSICVVYCIYLSRTVIKPFSSLKNFAERIAGGNLDIPLEMDRQNLFGAFTESFDIMREELKKARKAEAEANASKKELVAKLSHDIKTPVASIKAAAEVGAAITEDKKIKDNYTRIIRKADQINALITNLFTAALEELTQLSVKPSDMESREIKLLLENSDFLHRAKLPDIPDCLLYADKLRLQQVFDNIFANSYKYAHTEIDVSVFKQGSFLAVCIEDYGGGVRSEELPLLKEKFKRGSNTNGIEGAGLGFYISEYFITQMNGELFIQNGRSGLKVTVLISLSGEV